MKKKHIGSAFDDGLQEEGLGEKVTVAARERVALRADIRKGMADLEAGLVSTFDAEQIIRKARTRAPRGGDA